MAGRTGSALSTLLGSAPGEPEQARTTLMLETNEVALDSQNEGERPRRVGRVSRSGKKSCSACEVEMCIDVWRLTSSNGSHGARHAFGTTNSVDVSAKGIRTRERGARRTRLPERLLSMGNSATICRPPLAGGSPRRPLSGLWSQTW